jgi:hypothetical protein
MVPQILQEGFSFGTSTTSTVLTGTFVDFVFLEAIVYVSRYLERVNFLCVDLDFPITTAFN